MARSIATELTQPDGARLLETLQELMQLPALELRPALMAAATSVAAALRCDKIDAFLLDEAHQTLRAAGTSETPMGERQHALGLDSLALANGGRTVLAFLTKTSYAEPHAENDPKELRGLVEGLGIRSTLNVPFDVNGVRRGVLTAASATPEFFRPSDLTFLEIVARWVGILAHRAELAEVALQVDAEDARRRGAEEIITVLAHDLRNLLQPLMGRLLMIRMSVERGSAVSPHHIEGAIESVRRLSRLTENLLDLRRLDEGLFSLNLAPVDLAAIAAETASNFSTSSVPVRATGAPTLLAIVDGNRVRQALENVVANAAKYSPPQRSVEVRVECEVLDGKARGVLEVLDEGPGVPPEVVPTLFERFSSGADSKGLGLGLHLAHRIALAHGGELTFHPRAGGGARFRLLLPLEPAETDDRSSGPHASRGPLST